MKSRTFFLVSSLLFFGACKGPGGFGDFCGVWLMDLEPAAKHESAEMLQMLKKSRKGEGSKIQKEISEHIRDLEKRGISYQNLWFIVKEDHTWALYHGNSGKIKARGKWSRSGRKLFLFFEKEMRTKARPDSFFPYEDLGIERGKGSRGIARGSGELVDWVCKGFVVSSRGEGKGVAGYMYQVKGKNGQVSGEFSKNKMQVVRVFP